MADLKIDFSAIGRAQTLTNNVKSEFDRAERVSDDAAGFTGHDGLANKVREFGNNWDVGREKIKENLVFLADALTSLVDTFSDLDRTLAESAAEATAAAHD
ncbi:hypothetical protein [Cryobacterium sp. W22_MBD10_FK3]|uniref:hypothetical protein n=1 Tax=Cryobacterium sp. W22_MBD10_FK3 TaxID=3240273 RepID=UPI003F93A4E7